MDIEGRGRAEKQDEALEQAQEAATVGDPVGMVEQLHRSYYLDGITKRLRARWERLAAEDIKEAVAEAVDALYRSVRDGKTVLDIKGYLWKAADYKANDHYRHQQRERPTAHEDLDRLGERMTPSAHDDSIYGSYRVEEPDWEKRRAQAISIARGLLPKLGGENVQAVMGYVLDAIEADQLHIPNPEVAEALGLSAQTVRQSRSRGFRRLEQRAREEGLAPPTFGIVETIPHDE